MTVAPTPRRGRGPRDGGADQAGHPVRVTDVMSSPVHTTTTRTPVRTAAARLRHLRVAALPVLDDQGRVVGVVSELDLLTAAATGRDRGPVGAVMTTPVRCLSPGTTAASAAEVLVHDGLRSMPVVRGGDLVGIVSRTDLLAAGAQRPDPARPAPLGAAASPADARGQPDPASGPTSRQEHGMTHAHPSAGPPVVVGVDHSPQALPAARAAAAEAARRRAPLRMVLVDRPVRAGLVTSRPAAEDVRELDRQAAEHRLAQAVRSVADLVPGADVRTAVRNGDPAELLVDESTAAGLLVLGGRSGVRYAGPGSTAARVVAHARCPVLVLPDEDERALVEGRSVVVGVSGGPGEATVLETAFAEADARGCELLATHAWDGPVLEPTHQAIGPLVDWSGVRDEEQRLLAEALAGAATAWPDVAVRTVLSRGRRAAVLRSVSTTAELLVVGHRHRGRFAGLGSTTRALLHGTPCPLLVVPLPAHPPVAADQEP